MYPFFLWWLFKLFPTLLLLMNILKQISSYTRARVYLDIYLREKLLSFRICLSATFQENFKLLFEKMTSNNTPTSSIHNSLCSTSSPDRSEDILAPFQPWKATPLAVLFQLSQRLKISICIKSNHWAALSNTNKCSSSKGESTAVGADAPGPQLCKGAQRSSAHDWLHHDTTQLHCPSLPASRWGPVTGLPYKEGQADWARPPWQLWSPPRHPKRTQPSQLC